MRNLSLIIMLAMVSGCAHPRIFLNSKYQDAAERQQAWATDYSSCTAMAYSAIPPSGTQVPYREPSSNPGQAFADGFNSSYQAGMMENQRNSILTQCLYGRGWIEDQR